MTDKRTSVSARKRCRTNTCPRKKQAKTTSIAFSTGKTDAALLSGYEAVLCIDMDSQRVEVLQARNTQITRALLAEKGIHRDMLASCTDGKTCHYEWSMPEKDKTSYHQTSLMPLQNERGQTVRVMSFTKNITFYHLPVGDPCELREGGPAKTFAQMLLAAREKEKKELCKTLHDELGSSAVALSALLRVAQLSVEKGTRRQALADLQGLNEQLQQSLERLKAVVVSLRPPTLENDGALGGSIGELLENTGRYLNIPFEFNCDERLSERGISDSVKIVIYRVVQESLNNIAKHASAKHIRVSLKKRKGNLYLTIDDDGIGFNPQEVRSIEHIGLLAMRDSVNLLGGKITIKSAPNKGTHIALACPCIVYEEIL